MLCEKCHKREAKVYYTEIIHGEKKEQYLCEECAAQCTSFQMDHTGIDSGLGSLLSSILSNYYGEKVKEPEKKQQSAACPSCGMTYEEILKEGKLGCADCYRSFREIIERTLRQIQGADTHIGKTPYREDRQENELPEERLEKKEETVDERIEKMTLSLHQAVEQEEFEMAAKLRDEIRELKKEAAKNA